MMMCELCSREIEDFTIHHLIPRSKNGGGASTIHLCKACHKMVHQLYSNKELAEEYYSIELLRKQPEIIKFIHWVRKQDPHKKIKMSIKKR